MTVWQFGTVDGAGRAALALDRSSRTDEIGIQDAALVHWADGDRKPRTQHLACGLTAAPLDDGFWGLLFGLVFFVPLLGAAIGAAMGAETGALDDVGVDDRFMNRVRDRVTPGTSALFLLTTGPVVDEVRAVLADRPSAEPISTSLDASQEAAVRAVFSD
ncbi:DUF1269 domain-containing protein [Nocardioides hankookensis]